MQAAERMGVFNGLFFQQRDGRGVMPATGASAGPCRAASRWDCPGRRPGPPYRAGRAAGSAAAAPDRVDAIDAAHCRARPADRAASASPSGIHSGCSITCRYMSATHRAPSGPVWMRCRPKPVVARRQELRLLLVDGPPAGEGARPWRVMISRWTRLWTGSLTKVLLAKAGPNRSSR